MENHNKSKQNFVEFTSTSNAVLCPQEWENRKIPDVLLKKDSLVWNRGLPWRLTVTLENHILTMKSRSYKKYETTLENF